MDCLSLLPCDFKPHCSEIRGNSNFVVAFPYKYVPEFYLQSCFFLSKVGVGMDLRKQDISMEKNYDE